MKHFCFIALGTSLVFGLAARAEFVTGLAIVVDDDVITSGEIADKVVPKVKTLATMYPDDRPRFEEEARKVSDQQVEDLIERKLILHEFSANGYATNVLEAFIDDKVKKNIQTDFYGDRARLIKTLEAEGMTFAMYRRDVREDFIIRYMSYQNIGAPKQLLVSPLKIEQYYKTHQDAFKVDDQVKLRMIVISQPADGSPGEAKRTAEEILAKINSGVPFAEMAGVYSSGSQRAEQGERGWVERSYFRPELAQVAFSLKPGEHSGVIGVAEPEADHLLMVEDVRASHIKPLSDVRTDIEHTLNNEEQVLLRARWIERLKKKYKVLYY